MRDPGGAWFDLAALALVGLAAGAACFNPRPPAGAACPTDDSCPSGLTCIDGYCLPPGSMPGSPDGPLPADAPTDAPADAPPVDAPPDAFVDLTLVGHWKFDDSPSNGALDSSGRGHTATCIAACPVPVAGKFGNGYRFDPAQSHALTVADHPDFRGNYTIAAWFYADVATAQQAIMSKPQGPDTDNSWQLELLSSGGLSLSGGTTHYLEGPATTAAATWTHVAGTWDGTTKRLYVNGALVASTASTTTYDTHDVVLGADENSGSGALHWDGILDDIRIYNRVLSASEIQALSD